MSEEQTIVPIADLLPELRANEYAEVCEWDAARMALQDGYERADGEYLGLIRDVLKPQKLWQAYLAARGIPYQTALDRIHKAEGHISKPRKNTGTVFSPTPLASVVDAMPPLVREAQRYEQTTWDSATALAIPEPTWPPTGSDELGKLAQETPQAIAEPFWIATRRLSNLYDCPPNIIEVALSVLDALAQEALLDEMRRHREWMDTVEAMIRERQRPGVRIVK